MKFHLCNLSGIPLPPLGTKGGRVHSPNQYLQESILEGLTQVPWRGHPLLGIRMFKLKVLFQIIGSLLSTYKIQVLFRLAWTLPNNPTRQLQTPLSPFHRKGNEVRLRTGLSSWSW